MREIVKIDRKKQRLSGFVTTNMIPIRNYHVHDYVRNRRCFTVIFSKSHSPVLKYLKSIKLRLTIICPTVYLGFSSPRSHTFFRPHHQDIFDNFTVLCCNGYIFVHFNTRLTDEFFSDLSSLTNVN